MLTMISNPFPDQTPNQVLRRSYLIAQVNWTPTFTSLTLAFPQTLFAIDAISNFLSVYEYFRAGVTITVRVNSTPYHQGSLVTAIAPCRSLTGVTGYQLQNMRPVVLSASVQDSCTIELPYLNPLDWLDIATCADYAIGTFALTVLNPLLTTSTGVPASCTVSIFCAFRDPKVAGFIEPSAFLEKKKRAIEQKEKMKAQSVTERRGRVMTNSYGKQVIDENTQAEGEKKADKGTTANGIQKIVGGASEILKMIPVVGAIWSPIAKFISTYGKVLDEPYNPAVPQGVDQNLNFNDLAHMQGLFSGQQITMYPGVQTSKEAFDMESSFMAIHELAQVPALYYSTSFATQDQSITLGLTPLSSEGPTTVQGVDYLAFTAATFHLWRGSIKYLFHFVNSAFYSARFRISYATSTPGSGDGDLPQQIIDVKGDTFVEITVPYLFPTTWRTTGLAFSSGSPKLFIEMITPISGSSMPATPIIYLNIWRSGGEDIQFNFLRDPYPIFFPGEFEKKKKLLKIDSVPLVRMKGEMKAQSTIATRFKKVFQPIMAGSQFSGEFRTCAAELPIRISDMMKRWSQQIGNIYTHANQFDAYYPQSSITSNPVYDFTPFHYWANLFLFWRGSRRTRFIANASDYACIDFLNAGTLVTDGGFNQGAAFLMVNCSSDLLRHNDVEIPWISEVPYTYVIQAGASFTAQFDLPAGITYNPSGSFDPNYIFTKAGDDFQFLYLWPSSYIPT